MTKDLIKLEQDLGVDNSGQDQIETRLNLSFASLIYHWAEGFEFYQICELTYIDEGVIVRAIRSMDNICKGVITFAELVGNASLVEKMNQCRDLIKRDIIFAASLYLE